MTQICCHNVGAGTVCKLRAEAVPRPYLQNQAVGGWVWSACCSPPTPALRWTLQSTGVELVQSPKLPFWWDSHYPPFLRESVTCPSPDLVRSGGWLDLKSVLSTPTPHCSVLPVTVVLSHFSPIWLFAMPWTIARWDPLSMGFSRQAYWSGWPWPPPGDLPHPGIEPESLVSPALADGFFFKPLAPPGKPVYLCTYYLFGFIFCCGAPTL